MHIIAGINAQNFTTKDIIGIWETSVMDNGHKCTITYDFKADKTSERNVSCEGNTQNSVSKDIYYYNSTSGILTQLMSGQSFNGKVIWVNIDSMIYVTIKNGDIKTTGEELKYRRVKVLNGADYKPPLNTEVTEYFTSTWHRCEKKDAAFFRIIKYKEYRKSDGEIKDYWITGELQSKYQCSAIDFEDDKKNIFEGELIFYYKNGKIDNIVHHENGRLNGKVVSNYENGKIRYEGNFKDDKMNGKYVNYYLNGKIEEIRDYKDGELVDNKYIKIDEYGGDIQRVYVEVFKKNQDSWTYAQDNVSSSIDEVQNTLLIKTEKGVNANRVINTTINPQSNFSIEATFKLKKTKFLGSTLGLIFGSSKSNYNLFKIYGASFNTTSVYEGIINDSEWTQSLFIDQNNILKLIKIGDQVSYSINGHLVASKKDVNIFGGFVGFLIGDKEEIEMSNFIIKEFIDGNIVNSVDDGSSGINTSSTQIDNNPVTTGWKPLVDWGESLFPSYIISSAAGAKILNVQKTEGYLGDVTSVLGIKVMSPKNNSKVTIEIIDAEGKYFEKVNATFTLPEQGKVYVIYPHVLWRYDVLRKQSQTTPLGLTFKVQIDEKKEEKVLTAQMHSINDCPLRAKDYNGNEMNLQVMFAAYVNEEHPEIEKITKEALDSKLIESIGAPQSEGELVKQVKAVWRALQGRRVKYSNGTVGDGNTFFSYQRVRLFDDAINTAQANCVDGVVMFASILRKIDIDPVIILVPGHSFLGYYTSRDKNRKLKYLETTMLGSIDLADFSNNEAKNKYSLISFSDATEAAEKELNEALKNTPKEVLVIDVSEARLLIKPLGK